MGDDFPNSIPKTQQIISYINTTDLFDQLCFASKWGSPNQWILFLYIKWRTEKINNKNTAGQKSNEKMIAWIN